MYSGFVAPFLVLRDNATMRHSFLVAVSAVLLSACGETSAPVSEAPKPAVGSFGVDLAQMDRTVRPGDDFYS